MKRTVLMVGLLLLIMTGLVFAGGSRQGESLDPKSVTGAFDWRRAAGAEITVYMVEHPTQASIVAKLADFTRDTGITVRTQVTPEANYFDQVTNALSSRSGTPDIFMSGAYMLWDYHMAVTLSLWRIISIVRPLPTGTMMWEISYRVHLTPSNGMAFPVIP